MVRTANLNNELLKEKYLQTTECMLISVLVFLKCLEIAYDKVMSNNTA